MIRTVTTLVNNLAVLVMAAGESARLGQPKQLVAIDGQTLVEKTAGLAARFSNRVYCILGHQAETIASRLKVLPVTCVTNARWAQGMGSSIACGIDQLGDDIDAALVLLCDQWALTPADIGKLVRQWQVDPGKITASRYYPKHQAERVTGVPVIFPRRYFTELTQLSQTGARGLLTRYPDQVLEVVIDRAGFDLDTPDDLRSLRDFTGDARD